MNRKSIFLLIGALLVLSMTAQVFADKTPAGTTITNRAYGGYKDANGNVIADVTATSGGTQRIQSDLVSTTVTQVYGVDVEAAQSKTISRNGSVLYSMTVENTGNGADSFDLTKAIEDLAGSGSFTATIYSDMDGTTGVIDGADAEISSISNLAMDATYRVIVKVDVTDGDQGEVATTTLTAESQGDGTKSDDADLVSTVQAALITGTLGVSDETPEPGDVLTYTLTFRNTDNANEDVAYSTVVTLPTLAAGFTWGGAVTVGGTPITDPGVGGTIDFNDLAADGADKVVTFTVNVASDATNGAALTAQAKIDYDDSTSDPYTQVTVDAPASTVNKTVGLSSAIDPASQSGDPGDEIVYKLTVTNDGNGDDSYTLSTFSSSETWTWTYYVDDGSGSYESGTDAAGSTSGTVASGASKVFFAVRTIAAGTADATEDVTVFRFTASGASTSDQTGTTTVTAPILTLDKEVDKATAAPGETLTYTISIINSGTGEATAVVVRDAIPANTTYVAGSMTVDGSSVNDAANGDGGTYDGTNVLFELASIAGSTTIDVTFQVTIDAN